jgi:glycosyltransferase involved in cell wall biosynthesis
MKKKFQDVKVAIVHEWFVNHAGSEKVVQELLEIFPDAKLFSLVDFLKGSRRAYLGGRPVQTSFIQKLPFARRHFRSYFPLFPLAVESHDLREFDLIISSSHMVSKGILCRQDQLHISYCHSPCRFAWDLYHQYLEEAGLSKGLKGFFAQYFLHRLRNWDIISLNRVRHFVANSSYIGRRIQHVYRRDAEVVYPPVDTARFQCQEKKADYYFAAGRVVPYKKMDIIADAFRQMPEKKLILSVSAQDADKIRQLAGSNIEVLIDCPDARFQEIMAGAKAFVFAAEEDFGITMAEALACGTPVIAFGKGGAREIVQHGKSGLLFEQQLASDVIQAVKTFESAGLEWNAQTISESAGRFSRLRFRDEMKALIAEKWEAFQ